MEYYLLEDVGLVFVLESMRMFLVPESLLANKDHLCYVCRRTAEKRITVNSPCVFNAIVNPAFIFLDPVPASLWILSSLSSQVVTETVFSKANLATGKNVGIQAPFVLLAGGRGV